MRFRALINFIFCLLVCVLAPFANAGPTCADLMSGGEQTALPLLSEPQRVSTPESSREFPRKLTKFSEVDSSSKADLGDPSAPDFSHPEGVRVYTTGGHVLTWSKKRYGENAKAAFFNGEPFERSLLDVRHADGTKLDESKHGEDIWDPILLRDGRTGIEILYGSVMTPREGQSNATWPQDNWSRRTYAFQKIEDHWVRNKNPLFGKLPLEPNWVGHNYGHQFLSDGKGTTYVFYERVTEDRDGQPWTTELFARKMKSSTKADDREIEILRIPQPPWPQTQRSFGGTLVEGARPFRVGDDFFISFSAGEYMGSNYGIHLLWSQSIEGPYVPYLNSRKTGLKDFGRDIEKELPLTWGAARATFFQEGGRWWAIFHGIPKKRTPPNPDDAQRSLFLAPVSFEGLGTGRAPKVIIHP